MFDRTTLAEVGSFLAFAPAFQGGVTVALADLDGDGRSDLIAGAGPGAAPHVRVFGLDGTEKASFLAYDAGFRGGVVVAAGDTDGDGRAEVLTGAGAGGGPHVRVFGIDGVARASFMASDAQGHGGIHIAGAPVSTAGQAPSAIVPIIESLAGGANPFETLTIRGRFLAGVPATVIFDDGKGFRVEVPAEESAPGVLTVPVPPHFDAATNKLTVASTTVRVTVEQGGRKSAAKSLVVAGIPESAAPAGKLTKSWSDELYKFAVEEGSLSAADLASWKRFNDVLAELVSGAKDSVDLAARGLGSGVLRRSDLATMDRLLAAAVVANISPVLSASSIEALSDGDGTVPSRHRSLSMASVSALPSNTAGIRSNGVQPVTPLSPGRAIVQGGVTVLLGVVQQATGVGFVIVGVFYSPGSLGASTAFVTAGFNTIHNGRERRNRGERNVFEGLERLVESWLSESDPPPPPPLPERASTTWSKDLRAGPWEGGGGQREDGSDAPYVVYEWSGMASVSVTHLSGTEDDALYSVTVEYHWRQEAVRRGSSGIGGLVTVDYIATSGPVERNRLNGPIAVRGHFNNSNVVSDSLLGLGDPYSNDYDSFESSVIASPDSPVASFQASGPWAGLPVFPEAVAIPLVGPPVVA